jgi:hypothetical protein
LTPLAPACYFFGLQTFWNPLSLPRHWRLPTGNDTVSLPTLSARDFSLPDLNLLSSHYRGLIEFMGAKGAPLFNPLVKIDGKALDLGKEKDAVVQREDFWTPSYTLRREGAFELKLRYVCPPSERGFFLDIRLRNLSAKKSLKCFLGAEGSWAAVGLRINDPYPLNFWRHGEQFPGLAARHIVLSCGSTAPEYALSLGSPDDLDVMDISTAEPKAAAKFDSKRMPAGAKALNYLLGKNAEIGAGQELRLGITVGAGLEAVSAAAVNVEFKRRGLGPLSQQTGRYLQQRRRHTGNERLDQVLNWNSFFNLFYATGVAIDDERFVCLTSRSPYYYVCGAYWDRDSLLWSLPAIQMVDAQRARKVLEYAYFVQGRNIGVHSRFLDGVVLEPGFELDELCAPIIGLANYVKATGDQSLLKEFRVRDVLKRFERHLAAHRHPSLTLYDTLSGPDDDHEPQGYLAYDNVLVWKALLGLADLKEKQGRGDEARPLRDQAERVKQAVWTHLTADGPKGKMFVWSSDLKGRHRFYTSPPGCLQLLPYFGFCGQDDPTWKNTVAYLHSKEFSYSFAGEPFEEIGCAHSAQPWTLSLANSLLSGRHEKAGALLQKLEMDSGIACEAFESKTGAPFSGAAFATCAGFLAFAVWKAFGKTPEAAARPAVPVSQPRSGMSMPQANRPVRPANDRLLPVQGPAPITSTPIPKVKVKAKAKPKAKPKAAPKKKKKR